MRDHKVFMELFMRNNRKTKTVHTLKETKYTLMICTVSSVDTAASKSVRIGYCGLQIRRRRLPHAFLYPAVYRYKIRVPTVGENVYILPFGH